MNMDVIRAHREVLEWEIAIHSSRVGHKKEYRLHHPARPCLSQANRSTSGYFIVRRTVYPKQIVEHQLPSLQFDVCVANKSSYIRLAQPPTCYTCMAVQSLYISLLQFRVFEISPTSHIPSVHSTAKLYMHGESVVIASRCFIAECFIYCKASCRTSRYLMLFIHLNF
jgi:hypothetical protein